MKDIAIYGFGGFGREVACIINAINSVESTWNIIGYFDDGVAPGTKCKYGEVLGPMDALNEWNDELAIVFAIGSGKVVDILHSKVSNPKVYFPNIIAPNVQFFDRDEVSLGQGNILTFGCRISTGVSLGNFNILNGCVSLGHDVSMGDYNVMFPDSRISGMTIIGSHNTFGAKSFVAQQLQVGSNSVIGAGSVILRRVKSNSLYIGNPAKRIII